jgi:hypothetical protein
LETDVSHTDSKVNRATCIADAPEPIVSLYPDEYTRIVDLIISIVGSRLGIEKEKAERAVDASTQRRFPAFSGLDTHGGR